MKRNFYQMFSLICSAAIALAPIGAARAQTAELIPTSVTEMESVLMTGTWQLRIADKPSDFCREIYSFGPGNRLIALSGRERIDGKFELAVPSTGKGFILVEEYLEVNGEPDCQGDTRAKPGRTRMIRYIPQSNGTFQVCWVGGRGTCFGWVEPMDQLIG
ncbi:MAG: hypothetical protein CMK07_13355 [Ponticaulis sp.]|nr:hypothetical protein [Ponticaulis sp.]